jgi:hypothetical protein
MFCLFMLPWYCKGFVVAYDVVRCLLHNTASEPATGTVLEKTVIVFGLQTMIAVLLLTQSVCHSVADRVNTNVFCSEIALQQRPAGQTACHAWHAVCPAGRW